MYTSNSSLLSCYFFLIELKAITLTGAEILSLTDLLLLITIFILVIKIKNNLTIGHVMGLFGSISNLIILAVVILIGQGLNISNNSIIIFSSAIISLIVILLLLFSKIRSKKYITYGALVGGIFFANLIIYYGMYLSGISSILLLVSLIYFYNKLSINNN